MRKPRVGFFLLAPATFRKIGEGTARGSYAQRKDAEARQMVETASASLEVIFPGIIYETDDVRCAIREFVQAEVDCVLVSRCV